MVVHFDSGESGGGGGSIVFSRYLGYAERGLACMGVAYKAGVVPIEVDLRGGVVTICEDVRSGSQLFGDDPRNKGRDAQARLVGGAW